MAMKEKLDSLLDTTLKVLLVILATFGISQFLVVGIATLFGILLGVMQYVASVVLFGLGIVCLVAIVRVSNEE